MRIHELKATRSRPAEIVDGATKIRDVVGVLNAGPCGAVIVRNDGSALDAVLTESDVMRGLACHGGGALDMTASCLATTATASCTPNDYVTEVAVVMTDRGMSYLPVRHEGRLIDIVGLGEILRQRLADRRRAIRAIFASMGSMRARA